MSLQPTGGVCLDNPMRNIVRVQVFSCPFIYSFVLGRLYTWVKARESSPTANPSASKSNDIESQPIMMEERKQIKDESEN